jgi:hypothetical protein
MPPQTRVVVVCDKKTIKAEKIAKTKNNFIKTFDRTCYLMLCLYITTLCTTGHSIPFNWRSAGLGLDLLSYALSVYYYSLYHGTFHSL